MCSSALIHQCTEARHTSAQRRMTTGVCIVYTFKTRSHVKTENFKSLQQRSSRSFASRRYVVQMVKWVYTSGQFRNTVSAPHPWRKWDDSFSASLGLVISVNPMEIYFLECFNCRVNTNCKLLVLYSYGYDKNPIITSQLFSYYIIKITKKKPRSNSSLESYIC